MHCAVHRHLRLLQPLLAVLHGRGRKPGDGPPQRPLRLLLTIVTCNIYGLYWLYRAGDDLDRQRMNQGQQQGYLGVLYLLLAIFGFSIISYALLQSEINEYAAA